MDKIVNIGGQQIRLRANARTPRLYRHLTGGDLIRDMNRLRKAFAKSLAARKIKKPGPAPEEAASPEEKRRYEAELKRYERACQDANLEAMNLEIFENVSYVMARQGTEYAEDFPRSPGEWLDRMDYIWSVYEILPDILELWDANTKTTSTPKKK